MDIGKFIDEYVNFKSEQARDALVAKHVVATFVPYETKIAEAKNIVENSCYVEVDGKKKFWLNTPIRYILFIKTIITLYTDLEFDTTNILLQINLLEQYQIIEPIIAKIGPDYQKFQTILNMTLDDTMANERSLISYLENLEESIGVVLDSLSKLSQEQADAYKELLETN